MTGEKSRYIIGDVWEVERDEAGDVSDGECGDGAGEP
jgi:hypothetical protein